MRTIGLTTVLKNQWQSTAISLLLVCALLPAPLVLAEQPKTWSIGGAEIEDTVLFDNEDMQLAIQSSKSAVIENINYETVDGDIRRIEVEPVVFSDIFISEQRFVGLPIVCGRYQSVKSEQIYRYIFLGSTAFTFVEEKSDDFTPSWERYCKRA